MKCAKCKKGELVRVDSLVRMNPQGKIIYDYDILSCPVCKAVYEIDKMGTKGKPQSSGMSTLALFLMAGIITIPISIIVAIIDLIKGDSTKTHTGSIIALAVGSVIMLCIGVVAFFVLMEYFSIA